MNETGLTMERNTTICAGMKRGWIAMPLATAAMLGGCVNVSAPDKPIVINLNINVTQQVVLRLDGEAKSLIQQHPGIF